MDAHPAAARFPLLNGRDYDDFKADIAANGQQEPIWRYQGLILDGRNRHRACTELGIEPKFAEYTGDDPEGFVDSMNLHRRHLSPERQIQLRRERIDRVAEARRNGASIRQIAEEEQVSPPQVLADIREATVKGLTVEPEGGKVVGRDGRERPASRPTPSAPPQRPPAVTLTPENAPEPSPASAPRPPSKPSQPYPHSRRLHDWLRLALDQTDIIHNELGGIGGILAETDKWDWEEVRESILPDLDYLIEAATKYKKEISRAAQQV